MILSPPVTEPMQPPSATSRNKKKRSKSGAAAISAVVMPVVLTKEMMWKSANRKLTLPSVKYSRLKMVMLISSVPMRISAERNLTSELE